MKRLLILIPMIIFLAVALVVLASNAALDSGPVRTGIQQAIQRATGHEARIGGRIAVAWSLAPTIGADDIALLNRPGYSRPNLLTVRHVEAKLALVPLLQGRVEIPALVVVAPDLLLERDATGRPNWQADTPATADASGPSAPRAHTPVEVQRVRVQDGRIEYRGAPAVLLTDLQVAPAGGPVGGTLAVNGVGLALTGQAGPPGAPFNLAATGGGVTATLIGKGAPAPIDAELSVLAANLADASRLAGRDLPPLHDSGFTAHLGPDGLSALQFHTGAADLASFLPGLQLKNAAAVSGAPGQPVHATAEATLNALPLYLVLDTGLVHVTGPLAGPVTVKAQVNADSANATIQGSIDPAAFRPDLSLSARVPDLQRLGVLAGLPLPAVPALTDGSLDVRLLPAASGAGVVLRGLRITSAQGDLAGDIAVGSAPRVSVRGSLISQRLDLDAWTDMPAVTAPVQAAEPARQPVPEAAPVGALAHPVADQAWVIPDRPLPLAILRRLDADLRLAVANLQSHDAAYHNLETRLLLQDGRLRLDPLTLVTPGGPLQGSIQADAAATPPTAAIVLRAPALDAAALAAALGHPGALTGAVDLDADLHASGSTPHAMAATLSGRLAFGMSDGDIGNDVLAGLFGATLRKAGINFDPSGRSRIRCLGLRLDANTGQAAIPLLALDTTRLRLDGDGHLDLAHETMDLHVRPTLRLGPTSVAIPIRLTGPFRAPQAAADKGVIAPGRFGISIGGAAPDPCAQLAPALLK